MRSVLLGAYFADDPDKRHAFVRASARLTHVDPRAEIAALRKQMPSLFDLPRRPLQKPVPRLGVQRRRTKR